MGYDKTDESHYLTDSSGATVTKIFKQIFTESISEFSQKQFDLASVEKQVREQLKKEEEQRREQEKKRQEESKKKKDKDDDEEKDREEEKDKKEHKENKKKDEKKERED